MERTVTPKQRLELEQSEKRQKINELLSKDQLSDDERTELGTLTTRMQGIEVELRAAIVAGESDPDGEEVTEEATKPDEKLLELRSAVSFKDYARAVVEERAFDGAAAEFNQEIGLRGSRDFPLEMLVPLEERTTTDADGRVAQTRWLDRLFADTGAMKMGVTFEAVEPGGQSYPVTTAGANSKQRGRSEAADDDAWTMSVTKLEPAGRRARLVFSVEDDLRVPGLEAALRRDLEMDMTEQVDRAIFVGDANANENGADITGLKTAANVTEITVTQANKVKGPESLAKFASLVDGKHAAGFGDLRICAAVGAWRLWESTVINAQAENQTLAAFYRAAGLSWSVRDTGETAHTNGKFGAFIGLGRGIAGAGVAAIWTNGRLIRDEITKAANGEVALTLQYNWNFGLPRASNFARLKFVA